MKPARHDLHLLSGVYVLDAIDSDIERDRFERHLGRCHTCIAEVRGLREVTTRMAMAAALRPPPALHGRVLAAVRRTRQLPPAADTKPGRGPWRERWRERMAQRPGWLPRLALAAAAAGVAAAVVLGVILAGTQHQLSNAQAENRAIARVLAAPDARVLAHSTSAGGTATVIVSASERELIVTTAGLRPLPASKVYEAWLINPKSTRPAGLLPAPQGGRTRPLLATGLMPGDELGLTVEPAGGTAKPTTTPILALPLST
jgi:anti-sigma-K factor RskA